MYQHYNSIPLGLKSGKYNMRKVKRLKKMEKIREVEKIERVKGIKEAI